MRHKHADIIHAWAEGKEIQVEDSYGTWKPLPENPRWTSDKYRIKPKTIKFRNYLYTTTENKLYVHSANEADGDPERFPSFVKWIGGWQEVEIDS